MQAIGSNGGAQQHRWLCTAFAADTRHVSTTQIFQGRTVRWCAADRSLLRSTKSPSQRICVATPCSAAPPCCGSADEASSRAGVLAQLNEDLSSVPQLRPPASRGLRGKRPTYHHTCLTVRGLLRHYGSKGLVAAARQCLLLLSTAVLLPVVTGVPCFGAPLLQGCGACAAGTILLALGRPPAICNRVTLSFLRFSIPRGWLDPLNYGSDVRSNAGWYHSTNGPCSRVASHHFPACFACLHRGSIDRGESDVTVKATAAHLSLGPHLQT